MAVEPHDVRVLIPRVRRALDGPMASSSAAPSSTLDDAALTTVIADAIAEIIFFTGGGFPHTLEVTDRDDVYQAPTAWEVDPGLDEPETAVVAAQAAINHFFFSLAQTKTSETIKDEGQEWSYSLSATLIRDQMAYLMRLRDQALEQIAAEQAASLDAYVSFITIRDVQASALIEPYVEGVGYGGMEILR